RAFAGIADRDRAPDAGARARDDGDVVLQKPGHRFPPSPVSTGEDSKCAARLARLVHKGASSMCRNIKTLFNFEPPATDEEIRAASLQFVRKLSGFNAPSKANEAAFNQAVR